MATRLTYQAFDRLPHALYRLPHAFHRLSHTLYRLPHALYWLPHTFFRLPHTRLTLLPAAVVSEALLLAACSDDPTSEPTPDPIEVSPNEAEPDEVKPEPRCRPSKPADLQSLPTFKACRTREPVGRQSLPDDNVKARGARAVNVGWAIACLEAVAAFETALTVTPLQSAENPLTVYRRRLCTIGVTCVVT
jgi:hypothetical protein